MKDLEGLQIMVGQKIREIRKSQGMSLEELSELAGVSTYSIKRIERGRCNWRIKTLCQIARGLGMEGVEILFLGLIERPKRDVYIEMEKLREKLKAISADFLQQQEK